MVGGHFVRGGVPRFGVAEESSGRCHDGACDYEFPAGCLGGMEGSVAILVIFEDEHLLVVNKPAGMNTHAPSPYAGEGIYEWLKHREPRWASLAIIHRLDKETSGVLVFGKTSLANRSLTEQFTEHAIQKTYRLLTDRAVKSGKIKVESALVRVGEKYLSRPL